MKETFEEFTDLDRTVHDPSRLAILMALRYTDGGGFSYLQKLTNLSKGNLSNHLAKLEEAGMVEIERRFIGKKPLTTAMLTEKGIADIDGHWEELERLRRGAQEWRADHAGQSMKGFPGDPAGDAASE